MEKNYEIKSKEYKKIETIKGEQAVRLMYYGIKYIMRLKKVIK